MLLTVSIFHSLHDWLFWVKLIISNTKVAEIWKRKIHCQCRELCRNRLSSSSVWKVWWRDGNCTEEVRSWKGERFVSQNIPIGLRKSFVKTSVCSVVTYGLETWKITKKKHKKSFEICLWKRVENKNKTKMTRYWESQERKETWRVW